MDFQARNGRESMSAGSLGTWLWRDAARAGQVSSNIDYRPHFTLDFPPTWLVAGCGETNPGRVEPCPERECK